MRAPRPSLGLGSLLVAIVVLALGVGTVYAAIPNGNGTYRACLVKNTGAVRLINYPKVSSCPQGQKLISWNAKGPAGPAGAQGAPGPRDPRDPRDQLALLTGTPSPTSLPASPTAWITRASRRSRSGRSRPRHL